MHVMRSYGEEQTSHARVPAPTSAHPSANDWFPMPIMTPHT